MTATQPTPARHGRLLVASLATLALVLAACSATQSTGPSTSPSTSQPQTLNLVVRPGNEQKVHVGSLTGCPFGGLCEGDIYVGQDPLTDAGTGKQVGTILFECFVLDPDTSLYHCPGSTFDLTGRGQIVFSEQVYHDQSNRPATGPITGGSGEFLGATGTVITTSNVGEGRFVITIAK